MLSNSICPKIEIARRKVTYNTALALGGVRRGASCGLMTLLFGQGRELEANELFENLLKLSRLGVDDGILLEVYFCEYAHVKSADMSQVIARMRSLLAKDLDMLGVSLGQNVKQAIKSGHPHPEFLTKLAEVIAKKSPISDLEEFPEWRESA